MITYNPQCHQDFAYHGNGRLINAYIALIEVDPDADEEDEDKTLLRYVSSTTNDQNILTGRTLYATQKCIRYAGLLSVILS